MHTVSPANRSPSTTRRTPFPKAVTTGNEFNVSHRPRETPSVKSEYLTYPFGPLLFRHLPVVMAASLESGNPNGVSTVRVSGLIVARSSEALPERYAHDVFPEVGRWVAPRPRRPYCSAFA